jgi:alpha-galactosidase
VLKWADLDLQGRYLVRDLWRQKDLGVYEKEYAADVNEHGVVMVSLRKVK